MSDQVETPKARIVNVAGRTKEVPIEYPVEFNGKVYSSITVRRVTGGEMQEYAKAMIDGNPPVVPIVVDTPSEVWEAMDADDRQKVEEEALPFLPRRLREALEQTFETSGPSSQS